MSASSDSVTHNTQIPQTVPPSTPPWSSDSAGQRPAEFAGRLSPPGYEVLSELGRGGMGVVYLARQTGLDRRVALKMILGGGHAGTEGLARFRSEAEAVARLQHPGIVQIHEVGEHEGLPFFSMEFCEGASLDRRLSSGPLPPADAAALVASLARAMQHAHERGIVHRDLKPANVLLSGAAPSAQMTAKISDFGLARKLDDAGRTTEGAILGTPSYMAPEQASGQSREVGPVTDVYALGAILYECLTGRPPFLGASTVDTIALVREAEPVGPRRLQPKVPRDLETICLKSLQKEPFRRYLSAGELADDLSRFLRGEPIRARPVGTVERAVKWARRKPAVASLLATLVVVIIASMALITGKYLEAEYQRQEADRERGIAQTATADAKREEDRAKTLAGQYREQKTLAELEAGRAGRAEKDALAQEALARQAQRRSASQSYTARVALARSTWQEGDMPAAHEALDSCQWDLRGWEHGFLRHLFDGTHRTFRGHSTNVHHSMSVVFSPDGRHVASARMGTAFNGVALVKVWDLDTDREPFVLPGHGNGPISLEGSGIQAAFSPDGRILATTPCQSVPGFLGRFQSEVRLWQMPSGRPVSTFRVGPAMISSMAFSPDGRRLATLAGGALRIWDLSLGLGIPLLTIPAVSGKICFSPDGQSIAGRNVKGMVQLWSSFTGKPIRSVEGEAAPGNALCFSPDGRLLAGAFGEEGVRVWDAISGRILHTLISDPIEDAAFSPDARILATAGREGLIKLWDAGTGRLLDSLRGHVGKVTAVSFSPEGKRLASGGFDSVVKVWDVDIRQRGPVLAQGEEIRHLGFAPDGRTVCTGSYGALRVWDAATALERRALWHPPGHVIIGANADASLYLTGDARLLLYPTIQLRDGRTGAVVRDLAVDGATRIPMRFSPDGRLLALVKDGSVALMETATGRMAGPLLPFTGKATAVAFSSDGKRLAAGGKAGEVRAWDVAKGSELVRLKRGAQDVRCVAFDDSGERLAAGGVGPRVLVWNLTDRRVLLSLTVGTKWVEDICFSPDGKRLATAGWDSIVRVWETESGQEVQTLTGHQKIVTHVCFSPDGRHLASGDQTGSARLWTSAPAEAVLTFENAGENFVSVGLSADGKRIVARLTPQAAGETEVRCWDGTTGREVLPCTDAAPPDGQLQVISPVLGVKAELQVSQFGKALKVRRLNVPEAASQLRPRDEEQQMRWAWHAREAAAAERANRWFTAAFHLRQLLDHEPGSSDLRVRRLRARAQLASSAAARRPPVIPAEMLLADLYYLVERPESLAPLLDREQVGRLENSLLLCERKILSR